MRVTTSFFMIESFPAVPVDGAPNGSTLFVVKDGMDARREWLGLHEGESRIALLEEPILRSQPAHGKALLRVSFSTILIERLSH